MGKKPAPAAAPSKRPTSRPLIVLSGVLLGAIWGTVMWVIFELAGRDSGVRGWIYLVFTLAMMGGGVAAFFGLRESRAAKAAPPEAAPGRRGRKR
jgi:hypothetical protein